MAAAPRESYRSATEIEPGLLAPYHQRLVVARLGMDVDGAGNTEIRCLDAAVTGGDGTVREIPNAICMHEEDFGILWEHTDENGHVEVRRSRRVVVSSIVTVDNCR